ncbi:uncharacterized protein LOC108717770 isoform X2 [Xenopus laevis]|uniref:Uncharacterized protein n=2 Tax=Xenopus laevis TaxID=8355 RepID=A0A974CQZ7_XENLA|nr:uncharacterized protein LOC108717770 isoform X2 [Xenopus laevis]OCT77767.1 hypothetical protein XELAEV_18028862mg [Xenopus laevis]
MKLKDFSRWNIRFSVVYAVGIWVMITGYAYFHVKQKDAVTTSHPLQQDLEEEIQDTAAIPMQSEERTPGLHIKNSVVFKDNFVPFSRRIYNLVSPLLPSSPATTGSDSSEK